MALATRSLFASGRSKSRALLERALAAGTSGYDAETRRRLRVLNLVAYLIAVVNVAYTVQNILFDARLFAPVIFINLLLLVIVLCVPLAHRLHETAGGLLIAGSEYIALFLLSQYLGRDAGLQLQYFIGAAALFLIFGPRRLWLVLALAAAGTGLHIFAWFHSRPEFASIPLPQPMIDQLYVNASIVTAALIAASVYYAYALAEQARSEVDVLLHNILPDGIVERLKLAPETAIADQMDDASVMFLDLVGFTPLAERIGPAATVEFLGELFNELDVLAARHGVEKIKTIGDAYMAAAGVPEPASDHPARLAHMAIAARDCVRRAALRRGYAIDCRIGLAAGPVMAGVIGRHKFSYDVWGGTVNLAARMEGASAPGRILAAANFAERLAGEFELEAAGVKPIRGIGEVCCSYIEPRRHEK